MSKFFEGVLINICGSTVINVGTNFIKYGGKAKPLGIAMFGVGNVITFASFSFAPQSVLASISAVQFISNVVVSYLLFNERPTTRVWVGTAVIILGNVLIVLCSPGVDDTVSSEDLLTDYWKGQARRYIFAAALVGFWVLFVLFGCSYRLSALPVAFCRWLKIDERDKPFLNRTLLPAIIFVNMSALAGAQSVVHGKVVSTQLSEMASSSDSSKYDGLGYLVVVILFWAAMISLWMVQLGRALQIFNGVFVIPLTQACWIAWSIVSGGVTFNEFDGFVWYTALGFCVGVALLFLGIVAMAPRAKADATGTQMAVQSPQLGGPMGDTGDSIVVFAVKPATPHMHYFNMGGHMPMVNHSSLVGQVVALDRPRARTVICAEVVDREEALLTVPERVQLARVSSLPLSAGQQLRKAQEQTTNRMDRIASEDATTADTWHAKIPRAHSEA
eukprot:CAMPEP_0204375172 /NCGR_PEP_ID=MMETSP0469-20131031/49053_1 /ASSEMBLY_ACC=CAM_ASM_000384 /TAXON_ID=2969 /ORGANISM="Oxyrrhis marina" /LENGTH=444 /DNA_ID=CAMNT_0051365823 /DNA_START=5 /DNA_END=1336 /DNA_ORIENTATION=-